MYVISHKGYKEGNVWWGNLNNLCYCEKCLTLFWGRNDKKNVRLVKSACHSEYATRDVQERSEFQKRKMVYPSLYSRTVLFAFFQRRLSCELVDLSVRKPLSDSVFICID